MTSLFRTGTHTAAVGIGSTEQSACGRIVQLGNNTARRAFGTLNTPQTLTSLLFTRAGATVTCTVLTSSHVLLTVRLVALGMIAGRIVLRTMNAPQTLRNGTRGERGTRLMEVLGPFVIMGPMVMGIGSTNSTIYLTVRNATQGMTVARIVLSPMKTPQTLSSGARD